MTKELWTRVDAFLADALLPQDEGLEAALAASDDAGLPSIQVAPTQGKLLYLMARLQGARSVLEIGTLGGYSTIWLARAVAPTGRMVTIEIDASHAEVARRNLARVGLAEFVELRLGAALDVLQELAASSAGPFDFVFIDADKANLAEYFSRSLELCRVGSVIVVDNVVRNGAVIDPAAAASDSSVRGVRDFLEVAAGDPRVEATAIQTVSGKGYDGFAVALVVAGPDAYSEDA